MSFSDDGTYEEPNYPGNPSQQKKYVPYENDQARFGAAPPTTNRPTAPVSTQSQVAPQQSNKPTGGQRNILMIARWTALFVLVTAIIILLIVLTINQGINSSPGSNSSTSTSSASSCLKLKEEGMTEDGIYYIQPDKEFTKIQAYCDMTTDGGGWTLVASVHESDIKRKCDSRDLWSEYASSSTAQYAIGGTWENKMTFGNVLEVTKDDYKNRNYFAANAADVMIWHVPNGVLTSGIKSASTLRYRTTNQFLKQYNGNLKSLYTNNYPVKAFSSTDLDKIYKERTKRVLDAVIERSTAIKGHFPDWYEYQYDTTDTDRMRDSSIYGKFGNEITSYPCGTVFYGHYHSCNDSYVSSMKSSPFFVIWPISNINPGFSSLSLESTTHRPSSDIITLFDHTVTHGNYKLQYHLIQFSNTSYTTSSEFHFLISNVQDWKSTEPSSYARDYSSNTVKYHSNEFQANGSPRNIVMGYTLLSRREGRIVDQDQANNVALEILRGVATVSNIFQEIANDTDTLSVPVTFDKGTSQDVLNIVPPTYRPSVQPGFIQFRPFNPMGFPNALCPGVRLISPTSPEYVCIGGISNNTTTHGTCGDFAGWEGVSSDVVQSNQAIGSAHSDKDISSTILIFYR